jgi:ketosteroid isomerase-like protein
MRTLCWRALFCYLIIASLFCAGCSSDPPARENNDEVSLQQATAAIRDAFARSDVAAIVALHHPDIVKYFGGKNVVKGRGELERALTEMFRNSTMEFVDNQVESMTFNGDTGIETSIFTIKVTYKDGRVPTVSRGRAMVVYVKDQSSATGWLTIREMIQEAPDPEKS